MYGYATVSFYPLSYWCTFRLFLAITNKVAMKYFRLSLCMNTCSNKYIVGNNDFLLHEYLGGAEIIGHMVGVYLMF